MHGAPELEPEAQRVTAIGQLNGEEPLAVPAYPQGQGLAAATSVNRAGKSTAPLALVMTTPPFLERLAKPLERFATELGDLVQEQDAVVREGSAMYLDADPRPNPAAGG